jgi:S-disulfanyl-L-cysteine oxidoreductase SoxD
MQPGSLHYCLLWLCVTASAAATGCAAEAPWPDQANSPEASRSADAPQPVGGAPAERFGFGRTASPAEVAALAIAVSPDGAGLPAGRGTVQEGASIYAALCSACHGDRGEGTPAGLRLVGREPVDPTGLNRTIGNIWPYATTLFDYTRRTMPFDRPGSLSDDEVYAVTAFLLYLNEIIPEDAAMDAAILPQVIMPARDRFVPDDR